MPKKVASSSISEAPSWPAGESEASPGTGILQAGQASLDLPDGQRFDRVTAARANQRVVRIARPDGLGAGGLEERLEGAIHQLAGGLGPRWLPGRKAVVVEAVHQILRNLDVQEWATAHAHVLPGAGQSIYRMLCRYN